MDCRIIDKRVVVRDGSVVSVPGTHFGEEDRSERYFGTVVRLIQDKEARVKWHEDNSVSIEQIDELKLECDVKKKEKFQLRILPSTDSTENENIQFQVQNSTQREPPLDSSTPSIAPTKNKACTALNEAGTSEGDWEDTKVVGKAKSGKETTKVSKCHNLKRKSRGKAVKNIKDMLKEYADDDSDVTDDEPRALKSPKKPKKTRKVHGPPTRSSPRKKKQDKNPQPSAILSEEEEEEEEEYNVLDYSTDDNEEEDNNGEDEPTQLDLQKEVWKDPGWSIDPCERQVLGPRLQGMESPDIKSELDFVIHFLPMDFIKNNVIPSTNRYARNKLGADWTELQLDEFLKFLGLLLSMEVYEIHGPRRMYWSERKSELFPSLNYGKIMSRNRFELIAKYLQLSEADDDDKQVLGFLEATNKQFQSSLIPGSYITLDESMIKSYHRNLKGKIKIIRKPRPIGNEIKNLSDAVTNIVVNMELYEGKEIMKAKEFVKPYGATTATTIRLTQPCHGTGRRVIADSWFGSVKSAVELSKCGLYSIMLVKTAHKRFPRVLLGEKNLARGEWVAHTGDIDDVKLQACRFVDLKVKDFISTCSTSIPGNPRKTKYHGLVPRPQVAEHYLKYSAAIDIHNHFRTGSCGMEDIWHTKNPHRRQLAGILGFCFTNAFLAMKHFGQHAKLEHYQFKMAAAEQLCSYSSSVNLYDTRQSNLSLREENLHTLEKLPNSRRCFYCLHGYDNKKSLNVSTTFMCTACKVPLCKPTKSECWNLHISHGLPTKKYRKKN